MYEYHDNQQLSHTVYYTLRLNTGISSVSYSEWEE